MSNGKRKDIWTITRTIIEKNPGIKAKFLIQELREKTGLSRSTIYEHLTSFKLRKNISTEKGHYFPAKSTKENVKQKKSLIQRLTRIRERYSEVPERVFIVGLLVFYLFALSPMIFDAVTSANMAAWNFTGHEAARVVFPLIPYLFVGALIFAIIVSSLDIAKIFSRQK